MGLGWYATLAVVIASGQGVDSFASYMIGERECSRELIAVDGRPIMNSLPEPSPLPDPSMTTNFDVDPSYVAPLGSKVHGRGAPHLVEEEEDGVFITLVVRKEPTDEEYEAGEVGMVMEWPMVDGAGEEGSPKHYQFVYEVEGEGTLVGDSRYVGCEGRRGWGTSRKREEGVGDFKLVGKGNVRVRAAWARGFSTVYYTEWAKIAFGDALVGESKGVWGAGIDMRFGLEIWHLSSFIVLVNLGTLTVGYLTTKRKPS